MEVSGSRPLGPRRFPPSLQRALWAPPPHGPAASPGRSLSCSRRRRRLRDRKPGRSLWLLDCTSRLGIAMQLEEVGLVPAPAREPRLTRWLRRGSGILAHLTALGFTIFLTVLSRPGTSLFSWHPVFMALAFCLCMAEAILLFSPEHSLFFFCSRKTRIRLHWAGQTVAILCAILGLGFIISSKIRSELSHLVSWHSWIGTLTLLATGGQALCGLGLLCPRAARVSKVARLKLYHLTCGLVVYLMATVTVLLGMYSVWFQAQIKGAAWYLCLALPLYPALVIMHQISSSYLPRKKVEM
ncbi:cytochrome b561 domain-containing protein 1 isoform X3 [Cricetulus griseus]|uniref:ascorbate ferrireductase (transmembrane) n=2 Tax=Cricetulus griseus TaxID=10029 RepID=A0A9J7JBD6_CRIGR|nr:cytochrome b561 domain-containing protein 1 isoform X3 [Cricetulus griseus]